MGCKCDNDLVFPLLASRTSLVFLHSFALISTNRYQSHTLCIASERGKENVENSSIHKCMQILRASKGHLDPVSTFHRLINQSLVSVCIYT